MSVVRSRPLFLAGLIAVILLAGATTVVRAQTTAPPRIAFLARADNPVDALGASAVAAQLGGVVLLTGADSLDPAAGDGLDAFAPDLVILAGGVGALSEQVAQDVEALGYDTRRVAGQGRTATAAALAGLLGEFEPAFLLRNATAARAEVADVADVAQEATTAGRLAGLLPEDLGKVAFASDANPMVGPLSRAEMLRTTISATRAGFLVIRGSAVADNDHVPDGVGCGIAVGSLEGFQADSNTGLGLAQRADGLHRGACQTATVVPVEAGDHHVMLVGTAGDHGTSFRERTLAVEFVPFGDTE